MPTPRPEVLLIREARERAPHMSIRLAAGAAGISDSRWRQIESGYRYVQGMRFSESGPPATVARMAFVVGVRPEELEDLGADTAAAELTALLATAAELLGSLPPATRAAVLRKMRRDITAT